MVSGYNSTGQPYQIKLRNFDLHANMDVQAFKVYRPVETHHVFFKKMDLLTNFHKISKMSLFM